jgi:hypothetical protein
MGPASGSSWDRAFTSTFAIWLMALPSWSKACACAPSRLLTLAHPSAAASATIVPSTRPRLPELMRPEPALTIWVFSSGGKGACGAAAHPATTRAKRAPVGVRGTKGRVILNLYPRPSVI